MKDTTAGTCHNTQEKAAQHKESPKTTNVDCVAFHLERSALREPLIIGDSQSGSAS